MEISLEGKVAIVTGASRGIGLAVVEALLEAGARVAASSRRPGPSLEALAQDGRLLAVTADATRREGAERLVEETTARFGRLDILVNNIGATDPRIGAGFQSITDDEWHDMLETNLMSVIRTTRAALPWLTRQGGAIINISSINATMPAPILMAYSAAKAAVTNLSRSLAEELAPRGVRVNTVSPGPTRTPLWAGRVSLERAETDRLAAAFGISLGRFVEPEEVARLVVFLALDEAATITGADFRIDGGLVKTVH